MATAIVPQNARGDTVNESAQTPAEIDGIPQVCSEAGSWPVALVVDACPEGRECVCALLRGCGFRCIEASDAQQALSLAQRQRFSLGAFAIGLPGMSGAELAWRMREQGLDMPLVAVSGQLDLWDPDDLEDLGFDRVFPKPLNSRSLVSFCLAALGEKPCGVPVAGMAMYRVGAAHTRDS